MENTPVGGTRVNGVPDPKVEIVINLTPPDSPKDGTWLELPLAIIMLQAAAYLPDLPDHKEGDYIVVGELGLHGELRRVPGVISLAFMAKPSQKLIVPPGNEKEASLILAKPWELMFVRDPYPLLFGFDPLPAATRTG